MTLSDRIGQMLNGLSDNLQAAGNRIDGFSISRESLKTVAFDVGSDPFDGFDYILKA
jgi:hypothetical protein